ncbi:MAG: hypothetical protein ACFFCO_11085, partial [Promethearchaeota archaeon]
MHNFSYVIPRVLAGADHPYLPSDLRTLRNNGIRVIVTTMETRINENAAKQLGMVCHFIPVPDMTPPPIKKL